MKSKIIFGIAVFGLAVCPYVMMGQDIVFPGTAQKKDVSKIQTKEIDSFPRQNGNYKEADTFLFLKNQFLKAKTKTNLSLNYSSNLDFSDKLELNDAMLNKNYIEHFCEGISIKTISEENGLADHNSDFLKFHDYLKTTFPLVHAVLRKEIVHNYSLLYIWKGQNPNLEPVLLMAHMDVVPVDTGTNNKWAQPAFSGFRKDGYIWGRGSMDDKVSVIGILEAVEALIKSGYKPLHDIYFAFGHDEETYGSGAADINTLLTERGLHFQYILDEGGGIVEGQVPYIERPVALIGIAEKGYLTLQLTANEPGGHSSYPVDEGVVGILGKAIYRLQESPFPMKLTQPVRQMFRELGKHMPGLNGFIAMHPSLFGSLIKRELNAHPITNSLIQTTLAPTLIEGGMKDNIMPSTARMLINLRILPGETVQTVIARVKRVIHDKRVVIAPLNDVWNPTKTANLKSRSYKVLKHSIEDVFPKAVVAPTLNVSISDSRHYAKLSDNILRFVPLVMKDGDSERIHGVNERISEVNYKDCIRFYYHFIINSDLQL